MDSIKKELVGLNIAELNELSSFINSLKVSAAQSTLKKGDHVWVVQKTKKTPGVITKVNKTRCIVLMKQQEYNVPMSMIQPREDF